MITLCPFIETLTAAYVVVIGISYIAGFASTYCLSISICTICVDPTLSDFTWSWKEEKCLTITVSNIKIKVFCLHHSKSVIEILRKELMNVNNAQARISFYYKGD